MRLDELFQAVSDAAFGLNPHGGVCAGTIANPLAEAHVAAETAVADAYAFALALALLTQLHGTQEE